MFEIEHLWPNQGKSQKADIRLTPYRTEQSFNIMPREMTRHSGTQLTSDCNVPRTAQGFKSTSCFKYDSFKRNGAGVKTNGSNLSLLPKLTDLSLLCVVLMVLYKLLGKEEPPPIIEEPPTTDWKLATTCGIALTLAAATARQVLKSVVRACTGTSGRDFSAAEPVAKMAATAGVLAMSAFNCGVYLAMHLPKATDSASELILISTAIFAIPTFAFYFDPFGSMSSWITPANFDTCRQTLVYSRNSNQKLQDARIASSESEHKCECVLADF